MRLILAAALAVGLSACGKAEDKPEPTPPSEEQRDLFGEASDRMLAMTSPPGWIVSRWADGRVEHTGDSLLWTGMAMGALDCERGAAPEAALLAMLSETGGYAYRHPSESRRPTSLDGHLGLYWGISQRVRRCPETLGTWAAALATHKPVEIPRPFDKVLTAVKYQMGIAAAPQGTATLTDAIAAWAYAVVLTEKAGYRIHLGLLSLETLETSGAGLPAAARSKFCAATQGADMPTVDHWCGRGDLAAWAEGFQYDQWEFRHQRGAWESPDGKPGLSTPGLDLLVALRALYTPLPLSI